MRECARSFYHKGSGPVKLGSRLGEIPLDTPAGLPYAKQSA